MSIIDKVEVEGTIYDIVGGGLLPHLVIYTNTDITVTVTKGITTITAEETSSGVYECDVPEFGTYTITATKNSEVVTKDFNVTSVAIHNIVLSFIPDGDTVLPTDDVQTWLACAGIKDKTTYTTLSDVLADSITFNALLGDSNANKYMARSTTWASTLCADQYAMTMIGQYDVCCDALLGNSTWASAIVASAYADYILTYAHGLVPVMTSETTPSGEVSASSEYTSNTPAWKAFDNDVSDGWLSNEKTNARLVYKFPTAKSVKGVSLNTYRFDTITKIRIKNFKIEGSNTGDFNDWHTLYTGVYDGAYTGEIKKYSFNNETEYLYYSVLIVDTGDSTTLAGVKDVQFFGGGKDLTNTEKIHGANEEVAYYLDGATQVPISDPSTLDVGTYTFGSTIAKNPDSLSSDYTKQIRITPNTKEIVLRPDNALYWWGYKGNNFEDMSTANGWTPFSGEVFVAPTYNNNKITMTGSNGGRCGVSSKDKVTAIKARYVIKGVTIMSSNYGNLITYTAKNLNNSDSNVAIDSSSLKLYELSPNADRYITILVPGTRVTEVSAMWYE